MHGAHILPKPAHFGYMARESCHEPALFPSEAPSGTHEAKKLPRLTARERTVATSCRCQMRGGDAFREHFATGERPGTHRGDILASPRCSGIRSVDMLPRPGAAGEGRSGAQRYLRGGVGSRPRGQRRSGRAARPTRGPNRWKSTRLKSAALSTRGSGLESLAACGLQRATLSVRLFARASMRPFACARSGDSALSELNCRKRL